MVVHIHKVSVNRRVEKTREQEKEKEKKKERERNAQKNMIRVNKSKFSTQ